MVVDDRKSADILPEQSDLGIVSEFFEEAAETKRCPKCKVYSHKVFRVGISFIFLSENT